MYIDIVNYTKIIKKRTVLADVSLNFERGKIYGFRGANGSGKTMLLRAISGLITSTFGEIRIDGEILGNDISFPRSIGVLIESPAFLASYTGLRNLELIADIKGDATKEDLEKSLCLVGLEVGDRRTYGKYSLGMKQKLGIAAAIMEKPDILVLDEPFNALDEESVLQIQNLIIDEKERGATVFLACHDAQILDSIVDETIIVENGMARRAQ